MYGKATTGFLILRQKNGSLVIVLIDWLIVFVVFVVGFSLPMRVIPNEWMNEVVRQSQASYTTTQPCPTCLPACVAASCVKLFPYGCLQGRGERGGARHNMKHTASMWHVRREREREEQRSNSEKLRSTRWEVRWGRYCQRKKRSPHFARKLILVWNSKIWSGLVPSASRSSITPVGSPRRCVVRRLLASWRRKKCGRKETSRSVIEKGGPKKGIAID